MTKNKGKLAIVTGASTGIGYELDESLVRQRQSAEYSI
jgi:short-subunit dehydrogenase